MFTYPKMPNAQTTLLEKGEPVWVFDKLDGTNIAWEWSPKKGWFRQSTRSRLFDASDAQFGFVLTKFPKLLEASEHFYRYQQTNPKSLVVITELFGPNSFAGSHPNPEQTSLFVLDIIVDGRFLLPKELLSLKSRTMPMPKVLSSANTVWDKGLVDFARANKYGVNEGIVVKSAERRGVFAKVKTLAYLERIKARVSNWQDFWE